MGQLHALNPNIDDDREIEAMLTASIADYVRDNAVRPVGAILMLLGEDGSTSLTYCRAMRSDFALAGAMLLREAVGDE